MKFKGTIVWLAIVGLLSAALPAFSQTDYKNIKVDQLSDAQIKDMMNKVGDMGYSDAQLEQAAAAREWMLQR
ncbi:hypothetical protein LWM68_21000 [Niabella sp. W65]|nr:hypothetical protein [Niabella sp. W65]MCH7365017.1 hypothetical protein [Niabella sp. W65]ULT40835.1 hypothetical protein KRR40_39885 [Niabella sp. I65]